MTKARWLAMTFGLLFSALIAGVGVVLWGLSVAADPTFLRHVTSPYMQILDYAYEITHSGCDIVVYGDSSAMTSADPATIEALTNRKTCNIAQVQTIVTVHGILPVDLYLKQNPLPKYLVIQVAPEMFFQTHRLDKTAPLDPLAAMVRHHRGFETDGMLLRYPQTTLQFVSYVLQDRYKPNKAGIASFREKYDRAIQNYYTSRGLLTLPDPVERTCGPKKPLGESADFSWLEEARKRYAALGVKVFLTVSPIPECDSQLDIYRKALDSHLDAPVSTLPLGFFNDSDRHFTTEGSAIVSTAIAHRILALESGTLQR